MGRGIVLALLLAAALTGCGDATSSQGAPGVPAASPTAALPADGPVRTVTMILDDGDGPVMCLAGAAWATPPECDGPAVGAWDWDDHPEAESAGGARWGSYVVQGTWDGTTLAATEARPATEDDWPDDTTDFSTPCDEPAGGWAVVDRAITTESAQRDANRVAEALPDYGIAWGDQSINPAWPGWEDSGEPSLEIEMAMNDPRYTILNVGVTDDLERAEAALREVWGGPLCVTRVANTEARLKQVVEDLRDLPGNLTPQFGTISNRVDLPVVHDDGSIQAWVDEEYGADVVEVTSALEPVAQ
ncbi:hypothetical protein ASC64_11345 [Nocardioides sp. Root122]|uniref:hypothetical protein n=1 Tax=Nocardioides TaxID=1839 RepID=UPI000702D0FA|nr:MULTISPECIES: hypothetical protein [Nocardioides]KQV67799.1 hypothetical protein ASC64_11345 [Nocardioides sp. Root122]MCK9823685.1 hypothetical protein [Nocardioides cavernae]